MTRSLYAASSDQRSEPTSSRKNQPPRPSPLFRPQPFPENTAHSSTRLSNEHGTDLGTRKRWGIVRNSKFADNAFGAGTWLKDSRSVYDDKEEHYPTEDEERERWPSVPLPSFLSALSGHLLDLRIPIYFPPPPIRNRV